MQPSPPDARARRRRVAVGTIAAAAHLAALLAMLHARTMVPVEKAVWTQLLALPRPTSPPAPRPLPRPAPIPLPVSPRPVVAPLAPATPPAPPLAEAVVAAVPASAASAPLPAASANRNLQLTLSRDQLRTLESAHAPTLAQRLAGPPASSPLERRLAPEPIYAEDHSGGMTTIRSHGGCYILIPSGQSQADPFNHGGEKVAGRSTGDNC